MNKTVLLLVIVVSFSYKLQAALPLPPSNFTGSITLFTGFSCSKCSQPYLLAATWTPSPSPNVVSYEIDYNGTLVTTIPASGPFIFVACNLCLSQLCSGYTIAAIDDIGQSSVEVPLFITQRPPFINTALTSCCKSF